MAFGNLYSYKGNARTNAILAVAKANNVDLELVETRPPHNIPQDYLKINPLCRIPSFVGADGYELTECIAISIYITSQNEKTSLLGKTKQDYASIVRWMSFANHEILPGISGFFRPLIGRDPYNKKSVDDNMKAAYTTVDVLEEHLLHNTFLVGERVTLADLFVTSVITRGFEYLFDKDWREKHPNVTRWYTTVFNQSIYSDVHGEPKFIDEALKNQPPKKEQAPKKDQTPKKEQAPKAAPKPKAKDADEDEEEEDKPAPKAKHPLEALGKPTMILDDWKRTYSNEDTRSKALPWFWEHFKPDEYSLWRVDYKYNDELTMTFMTSNLIGGFFNRLEASRKYLFGCASVYGETNKSVIQGVFLVRGDEATPAFEVAPDYESYEFTKLDPNKEEDRAFVEDQWSGDKGVTVDGKEYRLADGKVFK